MLPETFQRTACPHEVHRLPKLHPVRIGSAKALASKALYLDAQEARGVVVLVVRGCPAADTLVDSFPGLGHCGIVHANGVVSCHIIGSLRASITRLWLPLACLQMLFCVLEHIIKLKVLCPRHSMQKQAVPETNAIGDNRA